MFRKSIQHFNFQGYDAFEPMNQPGSFIRHQQYRLKAHTEANDELYKNDASFKILSCKFFLIG